MRVTLIHNAEAGNDERPAADELQELITAAGHDVFYQSCRDENWTAALARPADLVAIAGGDGTVGRVAKALVGRHVPFTALPLGTANNISRTLGLTDLSLEQLIAGWARGRRAKFDIGIADGPWGLRYFIEGMGAGLFAWNMPQAHGSATLHHLHHADAKVAYA
ncbi:MAG TPA: diacylglycerol kinase family protein, partial [Burkholderiales bacterium]|nr:diacylglycerol kinase family protein [Burkholderiales bacterium]